MAKKKSEKKHLNDEIVGRQQRYRNGVSKESDNGVTAAADSVAAAKAAAIIIDMTWRRSKCRSVSSMAIF